MPKAPLEVVKSVHGFQPRLLRVAPPPPRSWRRGAVGQRIEAPFMSPASSPAEVEAGGRGGGERDARVDTPQRPCAPPTAGEPTHGRAGCGRADWRVRWLGSDGQSAGEARRYQGWGGVTTPHRASASQSTWLPLGAIAGVRPFHSLRAMYPLRLGARCREGADLASPHPASRARVRQPATRLVRKPGAPH